MRSGIWKACREILKAMLAAAKGITIAAIATITIIHGAVACVNFTQRAENMTIGQISEAFGVAGEKIGGERPLGSGKITKSIISEAIGDPEFSELIKSDPVLSDLMGTVMSKKGDRLAQIDYVNSFWNALDGIDDEDNYGVSEHWAKPSEMWLKRGGDCEDYAIAKYVTLRKCGFSESDLHLLRTHAKSGGGHVVLAVNVDGRQIVLDNLHEKPISLKQAASEYILKSSTNTKATAQYAEKAPGPRL